MSIAINENGVIKEIGVKTYDGFQITGYKVLVDQKFKDAGEASGNFVILNHFDPTQYTFLLFTTHPGAMSKNTSGNMSHDFGFWNIRSRVNEVLESDYTKNLMLTGFGADGLSSYGIVLPTYTLSLYPVVHNNMISTYASNYVVYIKTYQDTKTINDCAITYRGSANVLGFCVFLMGIKTT